MYDPLIIFLYNFKTIFGENYLIVNIYQVFRLGHCDSEQNCFVSHKRGRTRHLVYVSMTIILRSMIDKKSLLRWAMLGNFRGTSQYSV